MRTSLKYLSYDVTSWSEIKACNKIDKPLVVYRFSGNVMVHNNVAYIMTKSYLFMLEMRFQSNLNVI